MTDKARKLEPLVLEHVPLHGTNLIEASAGTGKTWTIAALYVRLLLEERIPVEQLLVVTYTKAATAELKTRVLDRLLGLREALNGSREALLASDDPLLHHVGSSSTDLCRDAAWLTAAIESFDLAPIYTIHGFSQRALSLQAFDCGLPFDTELVTDDARLLDMAVTDCWRREVASAQPLWAAWLQQQRITPAILLQQIQTLRNKPGAQRLLPMLPSTNVEAHYIECYAAAQGLWRETAEDAWNALATWPINRRKYNSRNLPNWRGRIDACLAAAAPHLFLHDCLEYFGRDYLAQQSEGGDAPPYPLFDALENLWLAAASLEASFRARLAHLYAGTFDHAMQALRVHKRERRLQSYDDLLHDLHAALHGAQGELLAERLRQRYAAALIDEFQDTDPVQYEIFTRIYGGSDRPLYFVGDPKQAIYAFRGADVHAYLQARHAADAGFTLNVNHRSTSALVRAVNTVFRHHRDPFLTEGIGFHAVDAAARADGALHITGDSGAALEIRFMARLSDKAIGKGVATERVAVATADEIAQLLMQSQRGEAILDGRPLAGGDIAVLVLSHHQGRVMKHALAERGIASVTYGQESVYRTAEAEDLAQILAAVAEPTREGLVRAALTTAILGRSGDELAALSENEIEWDATLERFVEYHRLAVTHGFIRMWRTLVQREALPQRLLALPGGERRMTNVQHLSDLLHEAASIDGLDLEGLLRLLVRARTQSLGDAEAQQLRLESDERLVRILTVHASKGLEFPLVYCPFLWDGKLRSADDETVVFHQHGALHIDFGSAEIETHRALAVREELSERLRLAYVALTRARHRCVLMWGAVAEAEHSALAWLLYAQDVDAANIAGFEEHFLSLDDVALRAQLETLARRSEGAIALADLASAEAPIVAAGPAMQSIGEARVFGARVPARWRVSSFSGLISSEERELPDYDALDTARRLTGPTGTRNDLFDLPGGVRTGTLIHTLFERIDFRHSSGPAVDEVIARVLGEYDYDARWQPVLARMLADVVATPLNEQGNLRLDRIASTQRLVELGFVFSVGDADVQALRDTLAPLRALGSRLPESIGRLVLAPARGFIKGYIDLVFEEDGRYYIADYKSNWLGNRHEDYASAQLASAMSESFYDLQYLLYTVALHRYLRLRIRDYDYDRHFGGVYYLFVRGMQPQRGHSSGVYATRPEKALIERLDALLTRAEACLQ